MSAHQEPEPKQELFPKRLLWIGAGWVFLALLFMMTGIWVILTLFWR